METLFDRLVNDLTEVLKHCSASTKQEFYERLERIDPEMTAELEQRMFDFDIILDLTDDAIQAALRGAGMDELARALKAAGKVATDKVFKNISSRAGEQLKESMDHLGSIPYADALAAQRSFVARLNAAG